MMDFLSSISMYSCSGIGSIERTLGARFFYPQFWNMNGWYGMLGKIRIVCIKNPRRSWPSKHCVTNMAADEDAAIKAVIGAIFLVLLVQ